MSPMGHLQPAVNDRIGRLLCKVYRPVDDVSAVTSILNGGSCSLQSFAFLVDYWSRPEAATVRAIFA